MEKMACVFTNAGTTLRDQLLARFLDVALKEVEKADADDRGGFRLRVIDRLRDRRGLLEQPQAPAKSPCQARHQANRLRDDTDGRFGKPKRSRVSSPARRSMFF